MGEGANASSAGLGAFAALQERRNKGAVRAAVLFGYATNCAREVCDWGPNWGGHDMLCYTFFVSLKSIQIVRSDNFGVSGSIITATVK